MLDDIRNSTLLTMVSAVLMAVAAIVLQPEPQREARPGRTAQRRPAATAVAARPSGAGTCERVVAAPLSPPDAPDAPMAMKAR